MMLVPYLSLSMAIVLEVVANFFLKRSDGMSRKLPGAAGLLCIFASFTSLSLALKGIDMATAYATWGGSGILLTAFIERVIFRQALSTKAWLGLILIAAGIVLLEMV